jgi:branched-chain amino acid transport system permease protein
MVLYIIAVGLSVTMGLMGFVNLAHGVFAMAGGYVAIWLMQSAGIGFLPAVLIACIGVALVSVPVERTLYARLYGASELDQVLMTIGLIFVASAAARFLFGPSRRTSPSLLCFRAKWTSASAASRPIAS